MMAKYLNSLQLRDSLRLHALFLRSAEPLSILACEYLTYLSRMTLSYPNITLLPVNNKPVYLSNVPNTCFWSNSQLSFVICWNWGCTRMITATMEISEWESRRKLIKSGRMRSVMEILIYFIICGFFPGLFISSCKSVEVGVNRRGFEQICSYVLFSLCVWTV